LAPGFTVSSHVFEKPKQHFKALLTVSTFYSIFQFEKQINLFSIPGKSTRDRFFMKKTAQQILLFKYLTLQSKILNFCVFVSPPIK
jgi:hypothetical protein